MILFNRKIKAKGYQHYLDGRYPPKLDPTTLDGLVTELRNGKDVKNTIIEGHIGLAMQIAGRYYNFHKRKLEDIVSEALLALTYAVDHAKDRLIDNNITPYITTTIHSKVSKFLEDDHLVRVPGRTLRKEKRSSEITFTGYSDEAASPTQDVEVDHFKKLDLTDLERKILSLKCDGLSDRKIGLKLGYSTARIAQIRTSIITRARDVA